MNYPALFSPLKVGPYQFKHRLALAPLTPDAGGEAEFVAAATTPRMTSWPA
jgi:2,4-dienoyl-CoA reductase-like NADH-dependent reductase (Old Yellow Enzyme family)